MAVRYMGGEWTQAEEKNWEIKPSDGRRNQFWCMENKRCNYYTEADYGGFVIVRNSGKFIAGLRQEEPSTYVGNQDGFNRGKRSEDRKCNQRKA